MTHESLRQVLRVPRDAISLSRTLAFLATMCVIPLALLFLIDRKNYAVDARKWVDRTWSIINALDAVGSALRDAERGQRGYLLTHDADYLAPYHTAAAGIPADLDRLQLLVGDDREALRDSLRLRKLAGVRMEAIGRTLALDRAGKRDEALAVIAQSKARGVLGDALALISDMKDRETVAFRARQKNSDVALQYVDYSLWPLFLLSLFASGVVLRTAWQEFRSGRTPADRPPGP